MKKSELRKIYLEKRKVLSKGKVEELSMSISSLFFNKLELEKIKIIHFFIPILKFNEVNTWLIIKRIWIDYPHIITATSITEKEKLVHVIFDKNTIFIDDNWGIPTPQNAHKINPKEIDLVITPLLAYDKNLQRVGYGKGYYDKFFSECKPKVNKIGVSLFPVLSDLIEDTNPLDIPLDSVISV